MTFQKNFCKKKLTETTYYYNNKNLENSRKFCTVENPRGLNYQQRNFNLHCISLQIFTGINDSTGCIT